MVQTYMAYSGVLEAKWGVHPSKNINIEAICMKRTSNFLLTEIRQPIEEEKGCKKIGKMCIDLIISIVAGSLE